MAISYAFEGFPLVRWPLKAPPFRTVFAPLLTISVILDFATPIPPIYVQSFNSSILQSIIMTVQKSITITFGGKVVKSTKTTASNTASNTSSGTTSGTTGIVSGTASGKASGTRRKANKEEETAVNSGKPWTAHEVSICSPGLTSRVEI